MDTSPLVENLRVEEGNKTSVYDDATGAYLTPGSRVVGNPTIGVGINVCFPNGLLQDEIDYILNNRVNIAIHECEKLPYWEGLDDVRKLAIADMMFNMGWNTFDTFNVFHGLMEAGRYQAAAQDLEGTKWYKQVKGRAERICKILSTGAWVKA